MRDEFGDATAGWKVAYRLVSEDLAVPVSSDGFISKAIFAFDFEPLRERVENYLARPPRPHAGQVVMDSRSPAASTSDPKEISEVYGPGSLHGPSEVYRR